MLFHDFNMTHISSHLGIKRRIAMPYGPGGRGYLGILYLVSDSVAPVSLCAERAAT